MRENLEYYRMTNLQDKSGEELYELFTKHLNEVESELTFLKKQVKERDLRIQLYQFSAEQITELKNHLTEYPNLSDIWHEFEIAYKIATGKNLIRFTDLDKKQEEYQKKLNNIK